MRTRKIRKLRKTKKKGGLFGLRSFKTKAENKNNCHRLAENYKKRFDYFYDGYECSKEDSNKVICGIINKEAGLHKFCGDNRYIEAYDFNRDGQKVKRRTEPFYDLKTIPDNILLDPKKQKEYDYPWSQTLFKKVGNDYVLNNDKELSVNTTPTVTASQTTNEPASNYYEHPLGQNSTTEP